MLVQYKDPKLLEGYGPLNRNMLYRVLAIEAILEYPAETSALIWDPEADSSLEGVALPMFVNLSDLEIIDSRIEKDWSSIILNVDIGHVTLVHSYAELLDRQTFIRVHDLDADQKDNEVLHRQLTTYGGNILLNDEENLLRHDAYLEAEARLQRYLDSTVIDDERNNQYIVDHAREYFESLRIIAGAIIRKIDMSTNDNQRYHLFCKLNHMVHMVEALRMVDGIVADDILLELAEDFSYPYDGDKILTKVKGGRYIL